MSVGHLTPAQTRWNAAVKADMARRHRKWPLGTPVRTKTPVGYLEGRINKHWRKGELPHGATVEFPEPIDMGNGNGARFCHEIPFRSLRPVERRHG